MREYTRAYPLFSLCGLNCGLCPRYQNEGKSKCPGCGGKDFHLQHPSCAVITCSQRHGDIEYCFLCRDYPCDRYRVPSEKDSFITYRNVQRDMRKAVDQGIENYQAELNEKVSFLEYLLADFNDGRKKNFYCLAVNLLAPADLEEIRQKINGLAETMPQNEKIKLIEAWFNQMAASRGIALKLKK